MGFGLTAAHGDIALVLEGAAATTSSGSIAPAGQAAYVLAMVQLTALAGTSPSLTVSLEESNDGAGGWTAVPGATTPAMAAIGSAFCFGVPTKNHVRVKATIGGTTPAVTAKVGVLAFSE